MEPGAPLTTLQPSSQFSVANAIKEMASANTSQSSLDLNDCDTRIFECDKQNITTSSDGGSTVRELNAMLEDGTTAYPSQTSAEWKTYINKRRRQNSSCSSTIADPKRGRPEPASFVYIKARDFDIAKEASKHPIKFKSMLTQNFGETGSVKLLKNCVRVTYLSEKQKSTMINTKEWDGQIIDITESWSKHPGNFSTSGVHPRSAHSVRGIIFGVPCDLTVEQIAEEVKALSARRLERWSNGQKEPTENVILTFQDDLPTHVVLGFIRRKVKPYVPLPLRCANCQRFGHHATKCHRKQRCVRCGEEHDLESCPTKENPDQINCVNCKGQHSAAYRKCTRYQEVSQMLKVAVHEKISYRDALQKVRSEAESVEPLTSTPLRPIPKEASKVQHLSRNMPEHPHNTTKGKITEGTSSLDRGETYRHQLSFIEFPPLSKQLNIDHLISLVKSLTCTLLYTVQTLPQYDEKHIVEKQLRSILSVISSTTSEGDRRLHTNLN